AAPSDELGVGKEVEPVVHELVEGAEQPFPLVGPALEQLGRLALAFVPEVRAEQVGHLPPVPHLLGHHAHQREQIIVRGRVCQEVALLLDGRELGVALIDDEVQERVADALIGDVHHRWPLPLALVMAELDVRYFLLAEFGLELEAPDLALWQADRVLPVAEVVNPFIEVVELANHQRLLLASDAPSMRSRAPREMKSSVCCLISRSSAAPRDPASLRYSASLARRMAPAGCSAHS